MNSTRKLIVFLAATLLCPVAAYGDAVPLTFGVKDRVNAHAGTIYGARHWQDKQVPLRPEGAPTALDYHQVGFDSSAGQAQEPLVQLTDYGVAGESYYARTDGLNAPYYRQIPHAFPSLMCRRSVAEKLRAVNKSLRDYGVELFVLDAWRPIPVQRGLWIHFTAQARLKLHTSDPQAIKKYAGKFCSNPEAYDANDEHTWPTHVTGGAVDVTLRRLRSGELLYMGSIFDDSSALVFTDQFERRLLAAKGTDISESDAAAVRNRRLLYWAMREQGFANYPYEWWHFDYGTQMWVTNSAQYGVQKAFYKPADWPKR